MLTLLDEIPQAIQHGLYASALTATLTIPDFCARAHLPLGRNPKGVGERYAAWFDKWVDGYQGSMTGEDCYSLRCSILHQGTAVQAKEKLATIQFSLPDAKLEFHNNVWKGPAGRIVVLSLKQFSEDVIAGARKWLEVHGEDPAVKENIAIWLKQTCGHGAAGANIIAFGPQGFLGPPILR